MLVVDLHTHLFPPEIIEKRGEVSARDHGFALLYGNGESKMADMGNLADYMDRESVSGVAAMGFPFEDGGLIRLCNDYILEAATVDHRIVPFMMIDRKDGRAAVTEADRCVRLGARGVGELAYYETVFSDAEGKKLDELARFLEEQGLPLVLHANEQVGHGYAGKARIDFGSVVRFVHDHPQLKIVLAHMGGGICFYEFMPEIRKAFANVYYDLAAAPFLYSADLYDFAARYLSSKVVFGSDYPLLSFKRYERHLGSLDEQTRRMFLYENGRRILGA